MRSVATAQNNKGKDMLRGTAEVRGTDRLVATTYDILI